MDIKNKQKEDGVLRIIHDNKIIALLRNIEILDAIENKSVKCKFCKDVIFLDTINGIFPESNTIKISCNKPECVIELSKYLNENYV